MRRACRSRSSSRAARDLLSASITSLPPALCTPPNSALWSARIRMDENCSGRRACRPALLTSSPSSCRPWLGQQVAPRVQEWVGGAGACVCVREYRGAGGVCV